RVDDEDVLALADGLVGTLGLARPAVDAFFGDDGCHSARSAPFGLRSIRRLWRLHKGGARSPLDPPLRRWRATTTRRARPPWFGSLSLSPLVYNALGQAIQMVLTLVNSR